MTARRRFWHVAASGTAFQAGSAAVDSSTIMSALVFQLTGNPIAVGAVSTILRLGWLVPQFFVGFLAGRGGASMPYYVVGAFGRTAAIASLSVLLWVGATAGWSLSSLGAITLVLWTFYAFVSGIVGVPYNDIVARSVPSDFRSRLLALRFFGGGLVALVVAAFADMVVRQMDFPLSYAAVLGLAAVLMLFSAIVFVLMGEPKRTEQPKAPISFVTYFRAGIAVFQSDHRFRHFVFAQWCGGAVLIAAPFYVITADGLGLGLENIALLLGAQTAGALVSNPLWGHWGDKKGKLALMQAIAIGRIGPPIVLIALLWFGVSNAVLLPLLIAVFFVLGALANGLTIAVIGFLMEISPDDRRPAFSGYFNALSAPAFLLPLVGGLLFSTVGPAVVFIVALIAALGQAVLFARFPKQSQTPKTMPEAQ